MTGGRGFALRVEVAEDQQRSWVVPLVAEVAGEHGWVVDEAGAAGPDALVLIRAVGAAVESVDEPAFVVAVEAGTPRSPTVAESADHLPPRFDLVLGEFKARRNQQVTRDAFERFLARVEDDRAAGSGTTSTVEENRALLAAVDAWLARTTVTAEAARAVHADRAILDAAIGAPVIDLVIVERAATRLTLRLRT